jgi:hypothetical protein
MFLADVKQDIFEAAVVLSAAMTIARLLVVELAEVLHCCSKCYRRVKGRRQ